MSSYSFETSTVFENLIKFVIKVSHATMSAEHYTQLEKVNKLKNT